MLGHTAPMAVALWVLGSSEEEILAWLDEHGMEPASAIVNGGFRARWMVRAHTRQPAVAEREAAGQ